MALTDKGLESAAGLLTLGLVLNGCLQIQHSTHISESQIVDERVLGEAIREAACYGDGRDWEYGKCKRPAP